MSLCERHNPLHTKVVRVCCAINLMTKRQEPFFDAQHMAGFRANRNDAIGGAYFHDTHPHILGMARPDIDLKANLAGKADAADAGWHAGDSSIAHGHKGKCLVADINRGAQRGQHVTRFRAADSGITPLRGYRCDPNLPIWALDLQKILHMAKDKIGKAG